MLISQHQNSWRLWQTYPMSWSLWQTEKSTCKRNYLRSIDNSQPPSTSPSLMVTSKSLKVNLLIESIRNYAILHIVTDEAKVFQTKERAPLLLCLEAFRPEEMMVSEIPRQLSVIKDTLNRKSKLSGAVTAAGATAKRGPNTMPSAEFDYVNYRSSSWDSSKFTPAD